MKIHVITEILLPSDETNVVEAYSDRESAMDRAFYLQEKYRDYGFSYGVTALEVKQ